MSLDFPCDNDATNVLEPNMFTLDLGLIHNFFL